VSALRHAHCVCMVFFMSGIVESERGCRCALAISLVGATVSLRMGLCRRELEGNNAISPYLVAASASTRTLLPPSDC
jgi:hypothetical protein